MNFLFRAITIGIIPFILSCGSEPKTSEEPQTTSPVSGPIENKTTAQIDPVCEMEKDNTWTDFTVYKQDTIWFCSEGCKKAFEARPEKYVKKG